MEDQTFKPKTLSLGEKVERIRIFRGIKQEILASGLGISQPQVSKIERLEEIEESLLKQIADILGVSSSFIKYFDESKIIEAINHRYNSGVQETNEPTGEKFIINPIAKIAELYEEVLRIERKKMEYLNKKDHS